MNNNQILFSGFDRLGNFPLDPTGFFKTKNDLINYLRSGIQYQGQRFTVYNDNENNGIYFLVKDKLIKLAEFEKVESLSASLKELDSRLQGLDSTMIERLEKAEGDISKSLNEIEGIKGNSENSISELENLINEQSEYITTELSALDTKITEESDNLNDSLTNINQILGTKIDTNVENLVNSDGQIKIELDKLSDNLDTSKTNLEAIIEDNKTEAKDYTDALKMDISQIINSNDASYKTRFSELEKSISNIKTNIGLIPKFGYKKVSALPTENIESDKIYLLETINELENLYEEYIFIENSWEKIGDRIVSFDGYATEEWVNSNNFTKDEINNKILNINETINTTKINLEKKIEQQIITNNNVNSSLVLIQDNISKLIASDVQIGKNIATVQSQISELVSKEITTETEINTLKDVDTRTTSRIIDLDTRLTALELGFDIDNEGDKTEISGIVNRITSLEDNDIVTNNQINDLNTEVETLKKENSSLKERVSTLENQITTLSNKNSELEGAIDTANAENIRLSGLVDTLRIDVDSLLTSVSSIINRITGSIQINEDGSLIENQDAKLPTVKAVFDLLQNYEFKGDEEEKTDTEGIFNGNTVELTNIEIQNEALIMSGISVTGEALEIN